MDRAESARRERPSRRLSFRLRRTAGPASTSPVAFASRLGGRAGLALVGLLLAIATLAGAAAQAQDITLVSNLNKLSGPTNTDVAAQPFTTGENDDGGFVVTAVTITAGVITGSFVARIVPATSSGGPDLTDDDKIILLTPPSTFTSEGDNIYAAPEDTVLEAEKTYHVLLTGDTGFTTSPGEIVRALSFDEGVSVDNWSIGDQRYWREADYTDDFRTQNYPYKIAITGSAVGGGGTAAEDCDTDRTGNDWCTTLTVGERVSSSGTSYGFRSGNINEYGTLDDPDIVHGTISETVTGIWFWDPDTGTDSVVVQFDGARAPHGTVFDLGGTEFTASAATEHPTWDTRYLWTPPPGFAWVDGQTVTVSANLPPVVESAAVNGTELTLTYIEALDGTSTPAANAYAVEVDGSTGPVVSGVAVSGKEVTLTLATAVASTATDVTVDYTAPASNPVRDESGINAPVFTDEPVTNNTEGGGGTLSADATLSALAVTDNAGGVVGLTPAFDPATAAYTVAVAGRVAQITLAPTLNDSGASYEIQDGNDVALTDADGDTATGFQVTLAKGTNTIKVAVEAADGTQGTYSLVVTRAAGPLLVSATVPASGNQIQLVFDELVSSTTSAVPASSSFAVTVDGTSVELSEDVSFISGFTGYTLLVASGVAFEPGAAVVVAYTDPTTGDDVQAVQNASLVDAASFTTGNDGEPAVVNDSTNRQPTSSDSRVTVTADTEYTFAASDFPFTDTGDTLEEVDIVSLPGAGKGSLKNGGSAISVGAVQRADLDNGELTYAPPAGATGTGFATFTFRVGDGDVFSAATHTMTIDIGTQTPAGVTVSKSTLTVTEQDMTGDNYTVVLDRAPTADVTVTVSGHAGTDVTPNPASLTFTVDNWETARPVTVTAADDADTTDDEVTLEHAAVSSDAAYDSIDIGKVVVTVADNDTAAEDCDTDRTGNDWCTTLTVGERAALSGSGTAYGFRSGDGDDYGTLDDPDIVHGTISGTVNGIWIWIWDPLVPGTDAVVVQFDGDRAPHGTVFDLGGTEFTASAATEHPTQDSRYRWDRPADFAWVAGQTVTVSANLPPVVESAAVNGTELTLTYIEALDGTSTPAASAYAVEVDGSTGPVVSGVAVSGKEVTLTLATAVASTATDVTVDYTVPTSNPVRDESGINAPGFTDEPVTNNTEGGGGTLSSDATLNALGVTDNAGGVVGLTPAFDPATAAYTAAVGGRVAEITLAPTLNDSGASYEIQDGNGVALTDADGDTATGFQVTLVKGTNTIKVAVEAADGTQGTYSLVVTRAPGPLLVSATVPASGDRILLIFDELVSSTTSAVPASSSFAATVDGTSVELSEDVDFISGFTGYTLLVASGFAFEPGAAVVVAYTDPTTGDDVQAVQNASLVDAASFTTGNDGEPAVVNDSTNRQPTSSDSRVTVIADTEYTFAASDFPFTDTGDTLEEVDIVSLPGAGKGSLKNGGSAISVGAVQRADLDNGELTYAPPAGATGTGFATFTFRVGDGDVFSAATHTMTIDIGTQTPAGVTVSKSTLTVTEQDTTGDNYTVVLDRAPTADVTVTVSGHAGTDVTPNPASLTFTVDNWETARPVTVTAADDADTTDDEVTLEHAAVSSDAAYDSIDIGKVVVTVTDNDTAAEDCDTDRTGNDWCTTLTVEDNVTSSGTFHGFRSDSINEYGTLDDPAIVHGTISATVNGIWFRDPNVGTDTVVVQFDGARAPHGTVFDLGGTEFTASAATEHPTWDTRYLWTPPPGFAWVDGQTVTVSANLPPVVESAAVNGTELTLTYIEALDGTSTPAASAYAVEVDGSTGPVVSGVAVSGKEVTLTLATAVASTATDVTVDYTVPASNPVRDESGINAPGFTDEPVTNNTVAPAGVTVSKSTLTVTEQDLTGDNYTVVLSRAPTADVTVTVSGHAGTDVTPDPASLTFTVDNWETAQPVKVTAGDDADVTDDEVTLEHAAVSADAAYDSIDIGKVVVTVADNDTAAEDCDTDRTGNDWCTTLTAGIEVTPHSTSYGFKSFVVNNYGTLDDPAIVHGTISETVVGIWLRDPNAGTSTVSVRFDAARVPHGTVFDLGGTEFTASVASEHPTQVTQYRWTAPADFAWVDGQTVTVSANLPPVVESAAVNGTELTLTYIEALDATSTPAASAYAVEVDGSTGPVVSGVAVSGSAVTLTLATAVASTATDVTVDYTAPTSNPVRDESGINAPGFTDEPVTNNTVAPAGVTVSKSTLTVSEENMTGDNYTVVLDRAPTANVTVTVSGHAGTDVTPDPASLTFTVDNWETAQPVKVTAGDDADVTDDEVTLEHAAVSTDAAYDSIDIGKVVVTVADNDTAQVTGVRLAAGDTVLVVHWDAVSNATGYAVQWKSGGEDYNTGTRQADIDSGATTSHTLTGLANGTQYTVRVRATRTDANDGAPSAEATATPAPAGVTVSKSTLTVSEENMTGDNYTVVLDRAPTADVTVTVSGHAGTDVTPDPASLTFTVDNWETAQPVKVTAGDDADVADDEVTLEHAAVSADAAYDSIDIGKVVVTVADNDTAQVTGVRLAAGDTVLVVHWDAVSNATGYAVQWKSGGEDYNTGTRQADIDSGATTSHTLTGLANGTQYTVRVRATRTDANDGAPSAEATATPAPAGVTVSKSTLTVTEEDLTGDNYTVVLSRAPTADVTVTVSGHAGTDVTPDPASLTFTVDNWETAQPVKVTAGDDADVTDDEVTLEHAAVSADAAYDSIDIDDVTVTVLDNDSTLTVTAATLVSNLNQSSLNGSPAVAAQPFTTGENDDGGFVVTAVTIRAEAITASFVARIVPATSSGGPDLTDDDAIILLTPPSTFTSDGDNVYAAPENTVLEAQKTYHVLLTGDMSFTTSPGRIARSLSSDEGVSVDGWSIGDKRHWRNAGETIDFRTQNFPYKIAITGSAVGGTLSSDATLSALGVTDNAGGVVGLTPQFASATTAYTAAVAGRVAEITVAPTLNDSGASYEIQDGNGVALTDADGDTATGFQVALAKGTNTIQVAVEAADGTQGTYSLVVTRAPGPLLVSATVPASGDRILLNFDELVSSTTSAVPASSSFAATVDGTSVELSEDVSFISGFTGYTLLVASGFAFEPGAAVVVAYTDPTTGDDVQAVQNASLVDAASFTTGNDGEPAVVNDSTNRQPTSSDSRVTVTADTEYTFAASDFPFTDTGDTLEEVDIVSLPGAGKGSLKNGGSAISVGAVQRADLDNGELTYAPPAGATGTGFATFTFRVGDGDVFSAATHTMTIDIVTPAAGVTVSKSTLTVTEEDTTGDNYTVVLDRAPTADVTVTVSGHAGTDVTPDPASLTFTVDNWETARPVTVTAADDADVTNDEVTLEHAASSTDTDYDSIDIDGVTVTVADNDSTLTEITETTVDNGWALKPTGLGPGDQFRLIFATSNTGSGNATSTNIADYNTRVQNRAAAGHSDIQDHSDDFRVVGCTADVDARDNTATTYTSIDKGVPIYWLNGSKVADDYEDFYDGSWDDEVNGRDEWGNLRSLAVVYTGCGHDGTESDALGGVNRVRVGSLNSSTSGAGPISSNILYVSTVVIPFYGLSGVFRVAETPIDISNGSPLVSNTHLSASGSNSSFMAQSFRTTNQRFPTGGKITVTDVQLGLGGTSGRSTLVRIREDDNGEPSSDDVDIVATLKNPSSFTANDLNTFTADPMEPEIELEPNTTYWISVNEGIAGSKMIFQILGNNDEEGEPGWVIGNNRLNRGSETGSWNTATASLQMSINGTQEPLRTCGAPELTDKRAEVWSATLTVEPLTLIGNIDAGFGYIDNSLTGGSLSETSFTLDSTPVNVLRLHENNQHLRLRIDQDSTALPPLLLLQLHFCERTFDFGDATESSNTAGTFTNFVWQNVAPDWRSYNTIEVALSTVANQPATGAPELTGTAEVGTVLTASLGTAPSGIADGNGLPDTFPDDYSFQWVRVDNMNNETEVGTDSHTYLVSGTDAGSTLKVKVSFTDDDGFEETVTSAGVQPPGMASDFVLVSNLDVSGSATSSEDVLAQSFTTGRAPAGTMIVTDVQLTTGTTSGRSTVVKIRNDHPTTEGRPGTGSGNVVATLVNPASFTANALNTFTAPPDTVLRSDTTYWITINEGIAESSSMNFRIVPGNSQTGKPNWTIGDESLFTGGSNPFWSTRNSSLHMSVNGTQEALRTCDAPDLDGRDQVWSATLDVGHLGVSGYGYSDLGGSLSQVSFTYDSTPVTVKVLRYQGDKIRLLVDKSSNDLPSHGALRFHFCESTLRVRDADESTDTDGSTFVWDRSGVDSFDWVGYDTIEVALSTVANQAATGAPVITGTAEVGEGLTASLGTAPNGIADGNGLPDTFPDDYSFQWVLVDAVGNEWEVGTDSNTYTVQSSDVFGTLKVKVSFSDDEGYAETVTSDGTAQVPAVGDAICTNSPAFDPDGAAGEKLWQGTLSVGDGGNGVHVGYNVPYGRPDRIVPFGALSDTTFTHDAVDYTIRRFTHRTDTDNYVSVNVYLDKELPDDVLGRLRLHICGAFFVQYTYGPRAYNPGTVIRWIFTSPWWGRSPRVLGQSSTTPPAMLDDWPVDDTIELALALAPPNQDLEGKAKITGGPWVGHYLEVTRDTIQDGNGLPDQLLLNDQGQERGNPNWFYRWLRVNDEGDETIVFDGPPPFGHTYEIKQDDLGSMLKAEVYVYDNHGYVQGKTSDEVGPVTEVPTFGVTLSETTLEVTEEAGTGNTYTVVLNTEPEADVTVTVHLPEGVEDVTASPASLTFTQDNWETARTVTVKALDDADTADDTVRLTHTAQSTDSVYHDIAIAGVVVTVKDNDTAQVTGVNLTPGDTQLVVNWDAVSNATGYEVQWKSGSQPYNTGTRQAVIGSGTTTTHTLSGLVNLRPYTVRVRATRTGATAGAYSDEAMATPTVPTASDNDATLSALTVDKYGRKPPPAIEPVVSELTPEFHPDEDTYDVVVAVPFVEVTPVPSNPNARVRYSVPPRFPSADGRVMALKHGMNVIEVKVTAPDGVAKETYTVKVRRASGSLQLAEGENFISFLWRSALGLPAGVEKNVQSLAQRFTTGSRRAGYTLTQIVLIPPGDVREARARVDASIWSAGISGDPGAKLFDLRATMSGDSGLLFLGPDEPQFLPPNEDYFLVLASSDEGFGVGKSPGWGRVRHDIGWDIAASFLASADGGSTWEEQTAGQSLTMAIWGIRGQRETAPQGTAFAASFEAAPETHDGATPFSVELVFTDVPQGDEGTPPSIANATLATLIDAEGARIERVERVDDDPTRRRVDLTPLGHGDITLALAPSASCDEVDSLCSEAAEGLGAPVTWTIEGPGATEPFTARFEFEDVPAVHDGSSVFEFKLVFSEAVFEGTEAFDKNLAIKHALTVNGGTITKPRRVDPGAFDAWWVRVRPSGDGPMSVSHLPRASCTDPGALCTPDGRALSTAIVTRIAGPESRTRGADDPLTASFANVPAEHDGEKFTFEVHFSEAFKVSYLTLRDAAFTVTNGRVRKAKRIDNPHHERNGLEANRKWRITVGPDGNADVTIQLPATTNCAATGALCTDDGRALSIANMVVVKGPAGLSVADAEAEEGTDPALAFAVTLDRARTQETTVNYATSDGTATAGADYTAKSGTLTFAPGEKAAHSTNMLN